MGGLGVGGGLMVTEGEKGNSGVIGVGVFGFGTVEGGEEDGQVVGGEVGAGGGVGLR